MADPSPSNGFVAGLVVAGTLASHALLAGARWIAPLVLPSIFARPKPAELGVALPPGLAQPSGIECIGCHALRTEMAAARAEIAAAAQALAVLTARAEEREQARRERLQEQARR